MQILKSEIVRLSRPDELKSLLSSTGPCISVYFPVNRKSLNPGDDERRWKHVVRQLEAAMERYGQQGRELIQALTDWDAMSEDRGGRESTLVVFCSPGTLRRLWIGAKIGERTAVAPQFYIRPLLPILSMPVFHLLALSQNDTRLIRCTLESSRHEDLAGTQTNFDSYMNSAKPDHLLDNGTSAGAASAGKAGSSKGMITGTTSDFSENRSEHLAHYFRNIDHGVNAALRDTREPVVLVGVDYEVSLYRTVNTYPHLLEESIHGAPNGLRGGEMHTRALEVIGQHQMAMLEQVLAEYNHLAGGGRATNGLKEVVAAAHDGRVHKLVVPDSLEMVGWMDAATHQVKAKESDGDQYDLLNDAAVQTILRAGHVFVSPMSKMPNGSPLAAIFRY